MARRKRSALASILHISYLHFGSSGQEDVWNSLVGFVNREISPHLTLVTGDIVDTPDENLFRQARRMLDGLNAKTDQRYLVCPGNHDRHYYGNASPRWMKKVWSRLDKADLAARSFSEVFAGHLAVADTPIDIGFQAGSFPWMVRFVGLDSAVHVQNSAQGFVALNDLENIKNLASRRADIDSIFLLMHHHLLPIQKGEDSGQRKRGLFAPLITVNAGTVLDTLAGMDIDVVLHGHDHHRNLAKYGSPLKGQNGTVFLGAGSACGIRTGKPASSQHASSNLLELREDQSIWVKEIVFNGGWSVQAESERCIVSAYETRRRRFSRRASGDSTPPTSELVKHMRYTHSRDGLIREMRTDWVIRRGEFAISAKNRTGFPVSPRVALTLPEGMHIKPVSGGFEATNAGAGSYFYSMRLDRNDDFVVVPRVDIDYEWMKGALLCRHDLELIPTDRRGFFRDNGQDFAAVAVSNELRRLELHVHFPEGFWPDTEAGPIGVYTQEIDNIAEPRRQEYLEEYLSISKSAGMLSLVVPYPFRGHRYCIAWYLPEVELDTALVKQARAQLIEHAEEALQAFCASFQQQPWAAHVSVALYVPADSDGRIKLLRLLRHSVAPAAVTQRPVEHEALAAHDRDRLAFLRAWWGEAIGYFRGGKGHSEVAARMGALAGERLMYLVPIQYPLGDSKGMNPLGLIRIGVAEAAPLSEDDNQLMLWWWERGMLSLLQRIL